MRCIQRLPLIFYVDIVDIQEEKRRGNMYRLLKRLLRDKQKCSATMSTDTDRCSFVAAIYIDLNAILEYIDCDYLENY